MSDDNNIEEMSPARRKMLAKLGKLPAAEASESTTEAVESAPAASAEVEDIEGMSPARRKMLAKLGKLPAAGASESTTEAAEPAPAAAAEVGNVDEMSPARRKILAKFGRLPSAAAPVAPTATKPAPAVAKPAPTRKAAARSTTTGEDHPFVTGKIKRSVKPILDFKIERRGWLSMSLGWGAFLFGAVPAAATMFLRYLFPNVLFEPPQSFKAGYPDEYTIGAIDETFKEKYGVWIGRTNDYVYALSTVCTHLGCTPNWLAGESKFKCPCHGSGFRKNGVHFEGPAPRPLERYWIGLAPDGQILIDKNIKFQKEKGQWENANAYLPWA